MAKSIKTRRAQWSSHPLIILVRSPVASLPMTQCHFYDHSTLPPHGFALINGKSGHLRLAVQRSYQDDRVAHCPRPSTGQVSRRLSRGLTAQATSGIKPVFTPFFSVLSCRFVLEPSSATFTFLISNLVFFVANLRSQLRPRLTSSAIHHSTAAPGTTPPVLVLLSSRQHSYALVQAHLAWPVSAPVSIIRTPTPWLITPRVARACVSVQCVRCLVIVVLVLIK